ncbi:hypothetical protein [Runella sp. SP2]|uniref:hypothetical protein n=1 Tax=Runella sp. SP2 TaxID=2268026 RepID=UPI000F0882F2|nr:hypothetical protein [Runella sp. SP2]AYQ32745.1 hypothetical protein DTQ70_11545 [Runella sp. SP2]
MEIKHLSSPIDLSNTAKLENAFNQFGTLLTELRKKEIPSQLIDRINTEINEINSFRGSGTDFGKFIKMKQSTIVNLLAKEVKIVPKNYYQTTWMSRGMAAIGIPIGVAIGAATKNMGLLGLGLPIGLGLGVVVGSKMDEKAAKENRQLNIVLTKNF